MNEVGKTQETRTVADVLRAALGDLSEDRFGYGNSWRVGAYGYSDGCKCAYGAITYAARGVMNQVGDTSGPGALAELLAARTLAEVIGYTSDITADVPLGASVEDLSGLVLCDVEREFYELSDAIATWNDVGGSFARVQDGFKRAIALAEARA